MSSTPPLSGLRVVEMGSDTAVPYIGKLLVDAGADVVKLESPRGDPARRRTSSGATLADGDDAAWFRFLNAGKQSVVTDLDTPQGLDHLFALTRDAHAVLDDHRPGIALELGIGPAAIRGVNPAAVVATLTSFGVTGPWADRPANDFTLQALTGSTELRGLPGQEPLSVGGGLGDIASAAFAAPVILATVAASRASGTGAHLDLSRYEAMMSAFQTYRPIYEALAPDYRVPRSIEIPSIEPASDGLVGFCCITGQQWSDFCAMIGHPEMGDDPGLTSFDGRMDRRDEVWGKIRAYTTQHTVAELVELASAFRIPCGPVGTGDAVTGFDHFVERGVYVDNPHGFTQPRPPYLLSAMSPVAPGPAPALGAGATFDTAAPAPPSLGSDPHRPLAGLRVVDLTAFWAGPVATNLLRVLGADLVKVESHVRLDGMRWASGLKRDQVWEFSPVYNGANAGKTVLNLDLNTKRGRALLERLIADADVVVENFSPRVMEHWDLGWDRIHQLNPRAVMTRIPAFGLDGPWRDRVGFAMTIEQVSGLANRTGAPGELPLVPKGVCDSLAGMHAMFATLLALIEREHSGTGQLVEVPLIEAGLNAAAEQVVEWSAYGKVLSRTGNRSPHASPQGLYPTSERDRYLAVSVETEEQWDALAAVVGPSLAGLDRHHHQDAVDEAIDAWSSTRSGHLGAAALWTAGVPAADCIHPNDSGHSPQHQVRRFLQWMKQPVAGWLPYFSFPFLIDGERLGLGGPAPLLGQHNREVLQNLGLSDTEIDALHEAGITGDWPAAVPRPT